MAKRIQLSFSSLAAPRDEFGGSLLTSHPKGRRPLDSKLPTHLVLRAERSAMRTPANFLKVNEIVRTVCLKHGVRLYEYANVGNHLHLLIRLRSRVSWAAFIREVTGRIASLTTVRWLNRPYTRIVRGWKRAFRIAQEYVRLNVLEADGMIRREDVAALRRLKILWDPSGGS